MTSEIAADLHMHTVGSDGTDTLDDRIEQARERDLEAIAITDHDRVIDELGAGSQRVGGIEVVTGVEIRADVFETKVELLGYFIDPTDATLESVLDRARTYRRERNRRLVSELNDVTDLGLSYEALQSDVRGGVGRPHLAEILLEEGYVDSIGKAFSEYLAEDGRCYVPMERIPCDEVVDAIHAAGGVASLAHPGRIRSDRISEIVQATVRDGVDAIETWYPYDSDAEFGVEDANRLAADHDLLQTGGSDCHGRKSGKFRIGTVGVSDETVETLRPAQP